MSMKKRRLRLTHGFGWGTGHAAEAACLSAADVACFLGASFMNMKKGRLRSTHGFGRGPGHAAEAAWPT